MEAIESGGSSSGGAVADDANSSLAGASSHCAAEAGASAKDAASSDLEAAQDCAAQHLRKQDDDGSEEEEEEEEDAREEGCEEETGVVYRSKKQLKRERRKEALVALKKFKKEKKKEAKREHRMHDLASTSGSRETLPPRTDAAPTGSSTDAGEEGVSLTARKQAKKAQFLQSCENSFHVIIDCDWESEHNDSALASLTQQIMFCYGSNRRSENPVTIFLSNLGPRATANLSKVNFQNWAGVTSSTEDYILHSQYSVQAKEGCKQLVYLSSDATEVLQSIDRNCAYVIGGIVDRNRLKGVTHQKAVTQGLRTMKLPIQQYFSLKATPVLAVNHVFDILLQVASHGDWVLALSKALPKRKEPTQKTDSSTNRIEEGPQEEEDGDEEEEGEEEKGEEEGSGTMGV